MWGSLVVRFQLLIYRVTFSLLFMEIPDERSEAGIISCDVTCMWHVLFWRSSPSFIVVETRAGLRTHTRECFFFPPTLSCHIWAVAVISTMIDVHSIPFQYFSSIPFLLCL